MDTPGQDTPRHKFMQSELVSHQLKSPQRKTRSNSINGDHDQEEKLTNNEASTGKPDVKKLCNKFESLDKSTDSPQPPPPVARKRVSIPTSNQIIATKLNMSYRVGPSKPPVPLPKARTISPPPNELNNRPKPTVPLIRLPHNPRYSVGETESSPSPTPPTPPMPVITRESSTISENEIDERPISIQAIREFFNEPKNFSLRGPEQSNRPTPAPRKIAIPSSLSIPIQAPFRLANSPEKYIKSQIHDSQSLPSTEIIDNATGDSSLSSNQNLSRSTSSDASFTDEEEFDPVNEQRIKLRKCVEEVYNTEKTYARILYVLAVKISSEVKNTCDTKDDNLLLTFNNTYRSLLGNIQQIYHLHNDIILPELEQYIDGRLSGNMWSVFEKNFKVIEVLYKNYYVTYYDTQGKLDELCKTQPLINEAMLKCQTLLGNLYPITQLNCPNQRLLRYILCMKTYLKYLDENDPDYKHSRAIHDELDRIAVRCEEELVVSAAQLNELNERLDNKFGCFKENRKLLWHGPVKKQSPRRNLDIASRYMILFSDCLLVCGEESGRKLEIKRELSMRGITIESESGGRASIIQTTDQTNTGIIYYPFRVNAVEKSYEFLADKESDRQIWMRKIQQASNDYNKRNSGIELRQPGNNYDEQQLGVRAPAWVNDVDVTRCQNCNNRFPPTIISTRRHHCRSCGRCICGSCSTKKLILEYCKNENEVRVCDICYTHFTGVVLSKNTSIWPKITRDVDRTILFGDFRAVQSGVVVWIALQEDYQLHVFGGKLDQAEDYAIKLPDLLDIQVEADTRTFTLREMTKPHIFAIDSNHQIVYQKNDILEEKAKSESKLVFYTNLWHETMKLARSTTLPEWYIRKRDSSDSDFSNNG